MRFFALLGAAALSLVVGCSSGSDSTATSSPGNAAATSTPTSPSASATTTPGGGLPSSGDVSFIAVVDVAAGQVTTRFNAPETWNTWFEGGGEVVSALILGEGLPRGVRLGLDGEVLTDSTAELQIRLNADGTARAYGGSTGDGFFHTFLEVDGDVVELGGDPTVLPLGFSAGGDYLLSYVGLPAPEGEAAISYTVHGLDGGVQSTFVNRLSAIETSGGQASWSPSGRYIAAAGIEGLAAHDIETSETIAIGASGSTEWSPSEDALLLIAGANELQVVRLPDLDVVSIEVSTNGVAASFDPSGELVTVSDRARRITTIFDATTGELVAELMGVAEAVNVIGFEPVLMTADGLVAALEGAPACEGILVIHPALGGRGQCLVGTNPRWAPDASAIAFTRGAEIVVFDIEAVSELVVASDVPVAAGGTLARWNDSGTYLLLEWPWGGGGWTDSLP